MNEKPDGLTLKTKIIYGVLILLFLVFVWPTPYEYTRKHPDVVRINRFSGLREYSGDHGWETGEKRAKRMFSK